MVLVEWVEVNKFILGGLLLLAAISLPSIARIRPKRYRVVSVTLGIFGFLFIMWGRIIVTSNYEMEPIFSPNRQAAVRTSIGPFDGEAVELFTMHGLRKEVVYRGDISDAQWTDDSHLVLRYVQPGEYGEGKSCPGSHVISVQCVSDKAER